mmetsp:Transcript_22647/g.65192  ORF Transcript_22647/g.65192 Transcript_22647/m.65192 type:complete len:203 (+) Transcript_22647:64-672(+)
MVVVHRYLDPRQHTGTTRAVFLGKNWARALLIRAAFLSSCWMPSLRLVGSEYGSWQLWICGSRGWLVGKAIVGTEQQFQATRIDRPKGGAEQPTAPSPSHRHFFSFHLRQSINIGIGTSHLISISSCPDTFVCSGPPQLSVGRNCEVFFRGRILSRAQTTFLASHTSNNVSLSRHLLVPCSISYVLHRLIEAYIAKDNSNTY